MTQAIPAHLINLLPSAKTIAFRDIRKGDTVASFEDGRLLMGVAHESVSDGARWLSAGDRVVAHEDETILLVHRPKLPTGHKSMIRLTRPLAGTVSEATLYARTMSGEWWPVGYSGIAKPDSAFDGVEWEEVFVTKEKPNE